MRPGNCDALSCTCAFVVAVVALVWSSPAHAWCRTTVNRDFVPSDEFPCDSSQVLYWSSRCVGFNVQRDASVQVDLATARALASSAFTMWSQVDCPTDPVKCTGASAGPPSITAQDLGPVGCDKVQYNERSGNANVIMFRDQSWPHDRADVTLALTTVTFNTDSGEIYDADMEVNSNPTTNELTLVDPPGRVVFDFHSILTHEMGHFLGLAHTQPQNTAATMYPIYREGKTFMRDPSQDDTCAICAAYPPKRSTVCDNTPRRGLALECGGEDPEVLRKGCSIQNAYELGTGAMTLGLGCAVSAVSAAVARRRRRRRA